MRSQKFRFGMALCVCALVLLTVCNVGAGQVWTKCHITCRCTCDDSIGNFMFVIPVDKSPDIGWEADTACKAYGWRACQDGCNGVKFTYSYQVTSP
jgi:hypothetical protein